MPDDDQQATAADAPLPCAPCRGTGQLISNLGGEQARVRCPWCEGGGVQLPGHDAQAARREQASASDA
jgi:DnaJ-class molecular chaperone